ncbi:MAG: response regulator [Bacteroidales bacterium]|nr:response regulator [Bacteroidales bacterium]
MTKTILIVEDFSTSRHVIKKSLENEGFKVLEAQDGRDALKFFNDQLPIDLLITDYNMPNLSGGDLIEEVRNMNQYEGLPILVLSTETDQDKKDRVSGSNITGWIQKPFEIQNFLKVVQRALRV